MAGSRCRHQKCLDSAQKLHKISSDQKSQTVEENEHKKSSTSSIREFFQSFGTQMDATDHVSPSFTYRIKLKQRECLDC